MLKPVTKKPVAIKKKKSRLPLILAVAGLLFVVALAILGWFAIKSVEEPVEEEIVDEIVILDIIDEVDDPEIRSGSDLDSDGLSDIEELLYGTDVRDPDTDGDTFLDGNEVFHRYSPLGEAPQTLLDTGAVEEYESEDQSITLTYPAQWSVAAEVDADFEETSQVIFRTNSTATIRLAGFSLEDQDFEVWFEQNTLNEDSFDELDTTLTKEGYIAYMGTGGLSAYVEVGGQVFVFEYDLADELEVVYLQTFQMMINSFIVK